MITPQHTHTPVRVGRDRAYQAPVAHKPYAEEDPRAHGSIVYTERCAACGHQREVAANQGYHEYGPWYNPELDTPAVKSRLVTPRPESFQPAPPLARRRIVRDDA